MSKAITKLFNRMDSLESQQEDLFEMAAEYRGSADIVFSLNERVAKLEGVVNVQAQIIDRLLSELCKQASHNRAILDQIADLPKSAGEKLRVTAHP